MRRLFRFALLTTLAVYLTFYLSTPTISLQQSTVLAQHTKANLETIENQFLALTTALNSRIVGFIEEISAQDWTLTVETKTQELAQQLANRNDNKSQARPTPDQNQAQVHRSPNQTASPTPKPPPTPTRITIDKVLVVHVQLGNVRTGPGMNYDIIGKVQEGDRLDEIVDESGGWYRFCCVHGDTLGWLHSSLVTAYHTGAGPPPHLNAAPYYQKYLDAGGIPILAPESVPDAELRRAQATLFSMVADRPDLLDVLASLNTRILLYDRDLGGPSQLPEFSEDADSKFSGVFAETSYGQAVVAPAMTTYHCNETLIHEIAHALDYAIRIQEWEANRKPEFKQARNQAYLSAMEAGLWAGRYESTVSHEYWAEMVVHWLRPDLFRTQFGLSDLSELDSKAARLIEHYLGTPTLPDFCKTRQFFIRGRVLDHRGNLLPEVWVTLSAWRQEGERFRSLRRDPDVVAKRTGPDGRFWIVEAVDPGLLEAADFFTFGIWRGEPADRAAACSIAGFAGQNKTVVKGLGQELHIEVTGQDLSGYTITIPTGFDWSPLIECQ
ncbi:MAG: SH3 domain-containing protein [Caldilineaceae bacterium]|nr:SH3 domain-containing protein [Caldilineaceae bacterium]